MGSVALSAAEMTRQRNTDNIRVFLGAAIEHAWEEAFLNRLRRDLSEMRVGALIVANFNVRGTSGQRQIDFLVLTSARLTHVELKSLRQDAPIIGRRNGPWLQDLGGCHVKEISPNPFHQAHQGTYAISDMTARLMERGEVPVSHPLYKDVDTLVCIAPDVPPGSNLESYQHVDVVGYADLLKRLLQPGPRPAWNSDHWDSVIREVGVYPEGHDSPGERRRQESRGIVTEYRQRFAARWDGSGFVPLVFTNGSAEFAQDDLIGLLEAGHSVGLLGDSGHGKSMAAAHASNALTTRGRLVIYVDPGEYTKGHLATLLARATAPYSTEPTGQLAGHAGRIGDQIVVVLDGFNQCPPRIRGDLLEELAAFRLRFPSTVLVTSSIELPDGLVESTLNTTLPDAAAKRAITALHGVAIERVSEAFSTPFELAIAAECNADLSPDATQADLYDAYIRQLAPSVTLRSGLRAVALALVDELRTSMRLSDATAVMSGAAGLGMAPEHVDAVLACRLLIVTQGHVRFSHELLGRFLAAEAVILMAPSSSALVEAIALPHRAELHRYVVALEHDVERRGAVLVSLANEGLYVAAVRGEMGPTAAADAQSSIKGTLADAAFLVSADELTLETAGSEDDFFPKWIGVTPWSPNERAMLAAAGRLLPEGYFVNEVSILCDRTDDRCRLEVAALRDARSTSSISTVVSSFVHQWSGVALGITIVLESAQHNRWGVERDPTVVRRIFAGTKSWSWSRLYLAATMCGPDEVREDRLLLPNLLRAAWGAGGYHLRLQALIAVHMCGRQLDEHARDTVGEILQSLETEDPWLQSSIVEALDAVDRLDAAVPTVEELVDAIRTEVLAMDDGPDARSVASHVCSSQWEPEGIVGPYYEAVQALNDEERLELFIRAASCAESFQRRWALERVVEAAPTGDSELDDRLQGVFSDAATGTPELAGMVNDNFDTHFLGVCGLARLGASLPPCQTSDPGALAWHLVDQLTFDMEIGASPSPVIWDRIIEECPWATIDVLFQLRFEGRMPRFSDDGDKGDTRMLGRLFNWDPAALRRLFEWGLAHLGDTGDTGEHLRPAFGESREGFMIRALGSVGGAGTAEIIKPFLLEPTVADEAVKAIRELNGRTGSREDQ